MAKYRLLNKEELKGLEKEFVEYLVVNGIAAEDWESMKRETPNSAERIVDLFSDVVFEKILRNVKFLEIHEKKSIRTFSCGSEEIELITMELETDDADFTNPNFISQAMLNPPKDLLVYRTEKPYSDARELEIFKMIENGCLVSNGKLHQTLSVAIDKL
ncbi:DUF6495 family protein [Portibacter lacus]|uniref:Uncharacterized protein n=1 Tax=Portibacter lacus TaxID=1099794 RepID=A0AA37SKG1_9BACT|nr:DUF6495 family protein [Portibacter lacus]GLR16253.1 hypothetical protein GCM10007940_08680 [Portibacter lacus]